MLSSFWQNFVEIFNKPNSQGQPPVLYSLLRRTRPLELTEEKIVVDCDNQGVKIYLEKRRPQVENELLHFAKKKLKIEFLLLEKKTKKPAPPLLSYQPSHEDISLRCGLSLRYSFDNFAVSGTNQVAYASAQAVVDNPGKAYNPLFLYGGVGVGKTHLAQAVARKILEKNNEKKIYFSPGDQFINELIEAIREKATPRFRKKYRHLDLLAVDDVQFIAGKEKVQEDFFHTFNSIIAAGGQIILTSDRPPAEIKGLEDRLRSRFLGGLIVDVQPPDFELRCAILLIKAREKNIPIDIEAVKIIAERVADSRELEGTLLSLYSKIFNIKERVDLEAVDSFFAQKTEAKNKKITPADVIKIICSYYNVKPSHLKGETRVGRVVLPRQVAMYFLREELKLKQDEIAFLLKRKDHTTIIHGVGKISRLTMKDPSIKQDVDTIRQSLFLST